MLSLITILLASLLYTLALRISWKLLEGKFPDCKHIIFFEPFKSFEFCLFAFLEFLFFCVFLCIENLYIPICIHIDIINYNFKVIWLLIYLLWNFNLRIGNKDTNLFVLKKYLINNLISTNIERSQKQRTLAFWRRVKKNLEEDKNIYLCTLKDLETHLKEKLGSIQSKYIDENIRPEVISSTEERNKYVKYEELKTVLYKIRSIQNGTSPDNGNPTLIDADFLVESLRKLSWKDIDHIKKIKEMKNEFSDNYDKYGEDNTSKLTNSEKLENRNDGDITNIVNINYSNHTSNIKNNNQSANIDNFANEVKDNARQQANNEIDDIGLRLTPTILSNKETIN